MSAADVTDLKASYRIYRPANRHWISLILVDFVDFDFRPIREDALNVNKVLFTITRE